MELIAEGIKNAIRIIISFDREFISIVFVSLRVSSISILLAGLLGIPFGIFVGTVKFKGRNILATILNTLTALPTVFVGLMLYSFLSRRGPLGSAGLLFTPIAMIMGQFILAFPIIAALSMGGVRNLGDAPVIAAKLLGAGKYRSIILFIREARFIIIASMIAGFGRVFSEVGISMMLGGNIRFYTRNITTAIALETSKGEFGLAFALGMVLLSIAFTLNIVVYSLGISRL